MRQTGLAAPDGAWHNRRATKRITMSKANRPPVLVAGGGIGGLSVALTLHQIGVPCIVLEPVAHLKPLGVGINLQPNAVRELYELGIGPEKLDAIGVQTKEWALVGLNGNDVYSEPRGLLAGYQVAAILGSPRAACRCCCTETAVERLGADAVRTGWRSPASATMSRTASRRWSQTRDGQRMEIDGRAADWRGRPAFGRARADAPARSRRSSGAAPSCGAARRRACRSAPAPRSSGSAPIVIAWCSTRSRRPIRHRPRDDQLDRGDHRRQLGRLARRRLEQEGRRSMSFIHHFADWNYDWLDVPACCAAPTESSSIR